MESLQIKKVTNPDQGLSIQQVQNSKRNEVKESMTPSIGDIIGKNIFTFFNLINAILAALVIYTGSYKNMAFMILVLCNIFIGIIQEIRAKKILDQLSFLNQEKATVIREGKVQEIPIDQIVENDILVLSNGDEIPCDGVIVEGFIQVNESALTGESDPIDAPKDTSVYSGCFVVSGEAKMQVVRVGEQTYVHQILKTAGKVKHYPSQLRDSLNQIIKISSFLLLPVGFLLFLKAALQPTVSLNEVILSSVAALIGMIPEGLVILTSVALAIASLKLARKKVLVQELYCIETLARVDVLCLDKTGTITQGTMNVEEILPWKDQNQQELLQIVHDVYAAVKDSNVTADAIREYVKDLNTTQSPTKVFPFSSANKCSGAVFAKETILIGAYSFMFSSIDKQVQDTIDSFADQGYRVLAIAKTKPLEKLEKGEYELLGLIVIEDVIRPDAAEVLAYLKKQDITIKLISGDDPRTVDAIAKRVGIQGSWKNMSGIKQEDIPQIVAENTVFGRVSPEQKQWMVHALKEQGHTVAMTGDGVNDVMALKEADCSIAMGTGTQAARSVSSLILLKDQFSAMPEILNQGRQVINNIERTASLFLVKTLFSVILSLITILLLKAYPFKPIQLTLVAAIGTGIPAFLLTLETNHARVKGSFLTNVLSQSIPGALSMTMIVLFLRLFALFHPLTSDQFETICTILAGVNALSILYFVCQPLTILRSGLIIAMAVLFGGALFLMPTFFGVVNLSVFDWIATAVLGVLTPLNLKWLRQLPWKKWLTALINKKKKKSSMV